VSTCVVIPVFKSILSLSEIKSLNQCKEILGSHDVFLVYPNNLNTDNYTNNYGGLKLTSFHRKFFDGIAGYNQLMLSPTFYRRFLKYKYMLIYQLDCYVFRDELYTWSKSGYDYIGAPFEPNQQIVRTFKSLLYSKNLITRTIKKLLVKNTPNLLVGNGGLSLRKVPKFWLISILFRFITRKWLTNEDYFWSLFAANFIPFFQVAGIDVAKKFSIEKNCRELYEESGNLPFGCHAWEKYEPEFWENYI
jgi:hypothetical protein